MNLCVNVGYRHAELQNFVHLLFIFLVRLGVNKQKTKKTDIELFPHQLFLLSIFKILIFVFCRDRLKKSIP